MTATILGRGQDPIEFPLAEEGPDRFGATLGEVGQPAALPDGQYAVAVAGDSDVGIVVVDPAAAVTFFVDTRPPQLSVAEPAGPLGLANDANGDLADCVQTRLTLSAVDQRATELCFRVGDGPESCGPVDAAGLRVTDELSFGPGDTVVHLRGTDCAGNEATTDVVVSTVGCGGEGLSLFITAPGDGESVRAAQDEDAALAGCQIDVRAGGEGFEAGADFVVCTDVDQGAGPAACGGGSSANRAPCVSAGGAGQNLTCPVTLADGTHRLRVVSTGPDRTSSAAITVRADCTAPSVTSAVIVEDDGDGCINRQERLDDGQNGGFADLTVRFQTVGLEDGRTVAVRQQPGDVAVGRGAVAGDEGVIDIQLPEGQHTLYLQATDAAGNPLPGAGGANLIDVTVDTTAPTPSFVNLMAGQCLNAAADVDGGAAGLQIPVEVRTGRAEGEVVTVALEGAAAAIDPVDTDRARYDFAGVSFPEGDVDLRVTVVDACGNVGSVGGFAQVDGRDDWGAPLPVALRVDTLAPRPSLEGLEEGRVYTLADDANADASDGLQVAVRVTFPGDGAEDGRPISIRSGAQALVTDPSPLAAHGGDPVDALVTLPDGDHALTARVTDACGNPGQSAVTNVRAEAGGCSSGLVGLAGDVVLGPGDGVAVAGGLQLDVDAQVDVLCAAATARLIVDGRAVGDPILVGAGAVTFRDVVLAEGEHLLAVRVTLLGEATDSQPARVVVDLTGPAVAIAAPAGPDPAIVLDDEDVAPGLQTQVTAEVVEAPEDSARTATLEIDGVVVAGPIDVDAGSPALVDFGLVTIPTGPSTLRVCVTDAGGNVGCGERQVDGDGGAPGVVNPTVDIRNRRRPRLTFSFIAPGDDGAGGGRVVRYRFRTARQPIVTEADWLAATAILATRATVDPGQQEVINTTGLFTVNAVHHVAIRAVDDRDREGPWVSVPVDLTMPTVTFDLNPAGGWGGDDFFNAGSLAEGPGDMDGDGRADVLVYGNRITGEAGAAIVFGAADPAQAEVLPLQPAANTIYFATDGGSLGDVNGDGAPDVALLGYTADFATTRVALYLGCPAGGGCARADVATPDAVIVVPGRVASFVTGVGDFFGADGVGDVLIGGSPAGGGNRAYVVGGRRVWPAELDATALDAAAGQMAIEVPQANAGVFGAGAGDLDGDGMDDLALTAGGNLDAVYVFYGSQAPADVLRFVDAGDRAQALVNPCSAQPGTFGTWLAGGADLTGDGAPDLLVGARSFKQIAVFDSGLAALECFGRPEVQFGVNFDLAGDVDGDGDVDLLVTHRDDQGRAQDAFLFYNDGLGRFGAASTCPASPRRASPSPTGRGSAPRAWATSTATGSTTWPPCTSWRAARCASPCTTDRAAEERDREGREEAGAGGAPQAALREARVHHLAGVRAPGAVLRRVPEPGDGPAGVLRDAVLRRGVQRVGMGGLCLEVTAWDGPARHLSTLGPFLEPRASEARVDLALVPPGTPPPDLPAAFSRPDLAFHTDGQRAWAAVDDSLGAVEAAIQLTLEAALLPRGGLLVHASAGVVGAEAWLMPGPSGTGKSTAARAGGFDRVLADEICVLRRTPAGFVVGGTPFWSADRPLPFDAGEVPLGCLVGLVQARTPRCWPAAADDVAARLIRAIALQRADAWARQVAFEIACDAAASVPCVWLEFPREGPWLTAVRADVSRASSGGPRARHSPLRPLGSDLALRPQVRALLPGRPPPGRADLAEGIGLLDQLAEAGVLSILFSGGSLPAA
ncbi:MAG: hypothetical protein R3F43_17390 [bacterium]